MLEFLNFFDEKDEGPYFCTKDHSRKDLEVLRKANLMLIFLRDPVLQYLEDESQKNKSHRELMYGFLDFLNSKRPWGSD